MRGAWPGLANASLTQTATWVFQTWECGSSVVSSAILVIDGNCVHQFCSLCLALCVDPMAPVQVSSCFFAPGFQRCTTMSLFFFIHQWSCVWIHVPVLCFHHCSLLLIWPEDKWGKEEAPIVDWDEVKQVPMKVIAFQEVQAFSIIVFEHLQWWKSVIFAEKQCRLSQFGKTLCPTTLSNTWEGSSQCSRRLRIRHHMGRHCCSAPIASEQVASSKLPSKSHSNLLRQTPTDSNFCFFKSVRGVFSLHTDLSLRLNGSTVRGFAVPLEWSDQPRRQRQGSVNLWSLLISAMVPKELLGSFDLFDWLQICNLETHDSD